MPKRKTMTRLGVTVKDLGSCPTRNGIAWSAEVTVGGKAAGMFVSAMLDGAFLVETVR